jgi:hypothetical protein
MRRIGPPSAATQSASRLLWASESGINRIVTVGAPLAAMTLPGPKPKAEPSPLGQNPDWKRIPRSDWTPAPANVLAG